jgi:transposase-like protein
MGKLKSVEELFEGRHFDREVIILCVRWYLRFKLSLRDLVEMMAERGLSMTPDSRRSLMGSDCA